MSMVTKKDLKLKICTLNLERELVMEAAIISEKIVKINGKGSL